MDILGQHVGRRHTQTWTGVVPRPDADRRSFGRRILRRLLRIIDGDPEKAILAKEMDERIRKIREETIARAEHIWY